MNKLPTLLLTGSEGFIGGNLLEHLGAFNVIHYDLLNGEDITTDEIPVVDYVIHLAAKAEVRNPNNTPNLYWNTNVVGTRRVLEANPQARILAASSSNANFPYMNPYAMSKATMETIPHDNCLFTRFTTVYGENSRKGMFMQKLKDGELEYTTNHIRDFIHVEDLCQIIVSLLESDMKGVIDVGTGKGVKVSSLAPDLPVKEDTPGEVQDNTSPVVWPGCRTVEEWLNG